MLSTRLAGAILIGAGVALAGVTANATDYKLAIVQSLTGAGAYAGVGSAAGMKFAADEINATGFLGADKLIVTVDDDASDRAQAVTLVSKYAVDPHVLAIMGPTFAGPALPAGQVANELRIPLVSITNTTALLKTGPWAFTTSQPGENVIPLLVDWVVNKLKVKNCIDVYMNDNKSMTTQHNLFKAKAEAKGVKIIDSIGVLSNATDFGAVSTRIVSQKPECIAFITIAPIAANVIVQLRQAGLDRATKITGINGLAVSDLVRNRRAGCRGRHLLCRLGSRRLLPTREGFRRKIPQGYRPRRRKLRRHGLFGNVRDRGRDKGGWSKCYSRASARAARDGEGRAGADGHRLL